MANSISAEIKRYAQEKGFDDDVVIHVVEQALKAAYKKQYGTDSNVGFVEEDDEVYLVSHKVIVQEVVNPVLEISLEEAKKLHPESEIGDELAISEDPSTFSFLAVQAGKQRVLQCIREIQKDTIYSEYATKVGEIIIGYYHREKNGNIYVDLGKVEGILPKRFQSPRDHYGRNTSEGQENRIKALVKEVKKHRQSNIVQLVLSRTDSEFVRRILELEVPEIYNGIIEIKNIVRDPGNRTKVAVVSNREDIDPVGACVGTRGARIQVIITELDGEKIDVIQYSDDPQVYIKNALSPAEVEEVIILDEEKRTALAIVSDTQLSLAIGKQGLNVRLANRLVDWNIDVKTEAQFKEMDIYSQARKAAENLFSDENTEFEEISKVSELPGITEEIVEALHSNEIEDIEDLIAMSTDEIKALSGFSETMAEDLLQIMDETLEVIEEDEDDFDDEEIEENISDEIDDKELVEDEQQGVDEELKENYEQEAELEQGEGLDDEHEYYECPECGSAITIDMTACPSCGVGLSFEFEEDDE